MRVLILGGTGTLGKELTKQLLLNPEIKQITIVSRGELAQKKMEKEFKNNPRIRYRIADIRDIDSFNYLCSGVDTVFHVAALKHVDVIEANPEESVKTNILGTMNVAQACISNHVPYCVFSSTDKAVEPINVYGMSKGISEKILMNHNLNQKKTHFSVFRWGNVCGSRGSVIPEFIRTLKEEKKVYITDTEMTRFWIHIDTAVQFMLSQYRFSKKIMIPEINSASVLQVVEAIAEILDAPHYKIEVVGMRPGEKIHEKLTESISSESSNHFYKEELKSFLEPIVLEMK